MTYKLSHVYALRVNELLFSMEVKILLKCLLMSIRFSIDIHFFIHLAIQFFNTL